MKSNAADVSVALDGTGLQTQLTPVPTALAFGKQDVDDGATAAKQTTITNSGTQDVTVSAATVSGDGFAITTSDCVKLLHAGDTCTVGATFDPATVGGKSGSITALVDAPATSSCRLPARALRRCSAPGPRASRSAPRTSTTARRTPQSVTLTNVGTEPVTLGGVASTAPTSPSSTAIPATARPPPY